MWQIAALRETQTQTWSLAGITPLYCKLKQSCAGSAGSSEQHLQAAQPERWWRSSRRQEGCQQHTSGKVEATMVHSARPKQSWQSLSGRRVTCGHSFSKRLQYTFVTDLAILFVYVCTGTLQSAARRFRARPGSITACRTLRIKATTSAAARVMCGEMESHPWSVRWVSKTGVGGLPAWHVHADCEGTCLLLM